MRNQPGPEAALLILVVTLGVLLAILVVAILYLMTLHKLLSRVTPRNRLMEPGQVWLILIPFFNLFWAFALANRIPDSLRNEFQSRDQDDGSDYGKGLGTLIAVLNIVSIPLNVMSNGPDGMMFSMLLGLIGLVQIGVTIVLWVRFANYSAALGDGNYDALRNFDSADDYRRSRDAERLPSPSPSNDPNYKPLDDDKYR